MKDELREPVGFLCRWLLLTLVAAVTGAVAWSSISATMAMGTNVRTRCLVPDLLIRPAGSFTLNGYLFPPPKHSESMVGIWCWPDGSVSFAQAREHVFHIWHTTGGRTVLPVTFRGIPYGATAFQTVLSVVRLVPADRKVVLVDAALADGRAKAGTGSFGRLLTAARARGETAMFYSGPLSDFGEARAKLGADRPDVPLLAGWDRKRPSPLTLAEARRLGRNVVVITPDADLAAEAARYGFESHWITPADAGPAATGVRRHDTLAQCAEFLTAAERKLTP